METIDGHSTQYEAQQAALRDAAQAMYAAQDAVNAVERGTDEYVEARLRLASARDAYDVVLTARGNAYINTVREAE